MSYSVELTADATDDPAKPWGAYLLFLRWRRMGAAGIDSHLETDFIVRGATEAEVLAALGRMPLLLAKASLDTLIRQREGGTPSRRWWDAMQAEDAS